MEDREAEAAPKRPFEPLYVALVNIRNTEVTAYWARYNIQAVLNYGLLAAALSAKPDMPLLSPVPAALTVVGILLALVWVGFVIVSKWVLVRRWERFLMDYERRFLRAGDEVPCLGVFSVVFKEESARSAVVRNTRNLNLLALLMPFLCILAWGWIGWRS